MAKLKSKPVDLPAAILAFRRAGRLPTRLPDQCTPQNRLVGARYGIYEPMFRYLEPDGPEIASGRRQ